MKRNFLRILTMALTVALVLISLSAEAAKKPKYVFFIIGDGMGISQVYSTNVYNRAMGEPELNFSLFPVKSIVSTYSASSLVTDSAAAGTALATSTKVNNSSVGIDPEGVLLKSILYYAKDAGCGAGFLTNDAINHATPAAFSANAEDRNMDRKIAEQILNSDLDFMAGATSFEGESGDMQRYLDIAKERGITVFLGPGAYKPCKGRVLYMSDNLKQGSLPYAIDRQPGQTQLSDFMEAAIEHMYLNYTKKGFILMVEGGQPDHCCHSNDIAPLFPEVNDLAKNVAIALEFYKKHPKETLILVTADHETGGLTLRNGRADIKVLNNQKCSMPSLTWRLQELRKSNPDASWEDVKDLLGEWMGFWREFPVSEREEGVLKDLYEKSFHGDAELVRDLYHANEKLAAEAVSYLTGKSPFVWVSGSHSGSPVGLWAIGAGAEALGAVRDNTDISKVIRQITGYDK